MKKHEYWIVVLVLLGILCVSCGKRCAKQVAPGQDYSGVKYENDEDGKFSQAMVSKIIARFHLPKHTVVVDEDAEMILLKSINGKDWAYDVDIVTIWKYYKMYDDIQEVVTSHPMSDLTWYVPNENHGVVLGLDSVFVANTARQFPLADSLVLVEGDQFETGVIKSFIIDVDNKKAILLPSNHGCVGFTSEEGFPICQSYRHRNDVDPDRYSILYVYDFEGKLVNKMSLEGKLVNKMSLEGYGEE